MLILLLLLVTNAKLLVVLEATLEGVVDASVEEEEDDDVASVAALVLLLLLDVLGESEGTVVVDLAKLPLPLKPPNFFTVVVLLSVAVVVVVVVVIGSSEDVVVVLCCCWVLFIESVGILSVEFGVSRFSVVDVVFPPVWVEIGSFLLWVVVVSVDGDGCVEEEEEGWVVVVFAAAVFSSEETIFLLKLNFGMVYVYGYILYSEGKEHQAINNYRLR